MSGFGGQSGFLPFYPKAQKAKAAALMERLDALTDPERVEDANMLAGWRAKYANEITERMKSRWWRRMARGRDVG